MKTIQTIFILSILLVVAVESFAQSVKIHSLPSNSGHYVIISNQDDFAYVRLNIRKINPDQSKTIVDKIQLWKADYCYISNQYFDYYNGKYDIQILGYDSNGEMISDISVPVIPENPPVIESYQWKCVSPNYAFGLTASYEIIHDSFWLDNVYDKYMWWDQAEVQYPISIEGVGVIWNAQEFDLIPGSIFDVPHSNPTVIRYNVFGGQIPTAPNRLLQGIPKKVLPQWEDYLGELGNPTSENSFTCVMPENPDATTGVPEDYYACVDLAVTFANILEPELNLLCSGMPNSNYDEHENGDQNITDEDGFDWEEWENELWNDFIKNDGTINFDNDENINDLWDLLISMFNTSNGENSSINDLQNFAGLRLDNMSLDTHYSFSNSDFIQASSDPSLLAFNSPAGFYKAQLFFVSGQIKTFFFALNENLSNSLEMKDMIEVSAYPNPIISNQYTININSEISTSIRYEVLNMQGHLLYEDNFIIKANAQAMPTIRFSNGIPSGMHIHRFILPDNSWKSILTTK